MNERAVDYPERSRGGTCGHNGDVSLDRGEAKRREDGGGLIGLNPIQVVSGDGSTKDVFAFAEATEGTS